MAMVVFKSHSFRATRLYLGEAGLRVVAHLRLQTFVAAVSLVRNGIKPP